MIRRRLALAFVAVLAAGSAHAYPLYSLGTQLRGHAWTWTYSGRDSAGQPHQNPHATQQSVRAAISETFRAFDAGQAKDAAGNACSDLVFSESTAGAAGTTARLDDSDGLNTEGIFVTSDRDPLYDYMQGGSIAFALPSPDNEGYVADCDTVFNAVDYVFGTDGAGDQPLQDVAMQETAHCFGLHHVCQQTEGDGQPPCDGPDVDLHSVMYPFADDGTGASEPDARDQDNMCQVYPVNGIGRPCDALDLSNNTGFAVPDCDDGTSCLCTAVGKICSKACSTNEECPSGARCDNGACVPDFYPGTQGVGVPTRTASDCDGSASERKPVGSTCAADSDCGSGMHCAKSVPGGYCTLDCHRTRCPSGSVCVSDMEVAYDALCVTPCSIDATTCETRDCGAGQHCQPFDDNGGGVCWSKCRTDADCDPSGNSALVCDAATGICYDRGDAKTCTGVDTTPDAGPTTCAPSCDGKACGESDGCGGTCTSANCPQQSDGGTIDQGGGGDTRGSGCGCGVGDVGGLAALALVALSRRRRTLR